MTSIRTVGIEFADQLVGLWVDTFMQAYDGVHTPENIRAYCAANFTAERAKADLADARTRCCAVFRDGRPTGFYVLKDHDCPVALEGGSAELKQIYVLAEEYGSGAGRALFRDALDAVSGFGRAWMWLSVSDLNQRAQAFYDKNDFEPLGPGPVFDVGTDRLTSTIMARRV